MDKVIKFILITTLFLFISVHLSSQAALESEYDLPDQFTDNHDIEINIGFSQISPKFKFKNFTIHNIKEMENYQYQLPDSLLSDLSFEEIILFIYEDPTIAPYKPNYIYDVNNFNGFRELISRPSYNDVLIKLLDDSCHNPARYYFLSKLLHVLSLQSIQDYLSKELKSKILITFRGIVNIDSTLYEEEMVKDSRYVPQISFCLIAGTYLQFYYHDYFDHPHLESLGKLRVSKETLLKDLEMVIKEKSK